MIQNVAEIQSQYIKPQVNTFYRNIKTVISFWGWIECRPFSQCFIVLSISNSLVSAKQSFGPSPQPGSTCKRLPSSAQGHTHQHRWPGHSGVTLYPGATGWLAVTDWSASAVCTAVTGGSGRPMPVFFLAETEDYSSRDLVPSSVVSWFQN